MAKKVFKAKVVSEKMHKTVVVSVETPKKHPIYGKSIRNTRRFKAHNDINVKLGDIVVIEETHPYSKDTTWLVKEILPNK